MSAQTMEFKTEVKQLLDLMIHSLYSHKEIFLRELISNASDAIDKARYESLTNQALLEGGGDWKIELIADKEAGTLTIRDNGIGLTRDEAITALGTIAHSGTKEFMKALQSKEVKENPELIGQFGVGFYSSFMVADKVSVRSRKAGAANDQGIVWESSADGSYTIDTITKETRGTDVILYMKEEEKNLLDQWELRRIVRKYSDYIEHAICMEIDNYDDKGEKDGTKEDILNSRKAIWLKDKSEITAEEYKEFYKHVSHDFTDPAETIHYRAEGTNEFSALLYIPSRAPFDLFYKEYKIGPTLYVKRVQIMEHCEALMPVYLRFVKGVVDSSDLPLNVSREILQNNRMIEVIKKNITKRVLDALSHMKQNDFDKYLAFYKEFGKVLKEGIHYDATRKEAIAELLLFESSKTAAGEFTNLSDYVTNMPSDQNEIYYITGESRGEVASSPYLEAFRDKGYEVLFMYDEIDDYIITNLGEFKGKKFKSVIKGDIALDKDKEEQKKEAEKKYKLLIDLLKDRLKDDVGEVRLSGRLKDSACCLVAGETDMDPQMEKLLKSMGQEVPDTKRILELNSEHPVVAKMNALFEENKENPILGEYAEMLYDQALIMEGSKPKDPSRFAQRISRLMAGA
ncbi:molecular chaperone HtpG [Chrysiogenes arsenatis]|uniref:molecular chaperone HtpG n=1 Tax=Chrysiogenes arsenatis TaxID=309797 RepID=UPI000400D90B|nr:molecular chaperone HtpG [Chrysiogenes arsenatis]